MEYRKLHQSEIDKLCSQGCSCDDWSLVSVADGINVKYIRNSRFSGSIRLGIFEEFRQMPGGIRKHSGIFNATLHNVSVGSNCCIENVKNYIANYEVGDGTFIENVDIILVDGRSSFGNGVEVSVLNETGGREVTIHNRLSSHEAYIEAMYRHHPLMVQKLKDMASSYAESISSEFGRIGSNVTIVDAGYIKNVNVGDFAKIEGAGRLKNGSINSCAAAPVHIGYGVVCDDFIISSGSSVEDGTMLTRCFVGQSCTLGHTYSASDSLFFSNCREENGEACAIFAGPFTVTHHKSTLLIAGIYSFMNAGSGSNQSNHMYKLGPIHQGSMERGAKTTSDSYILWPSRVGAFSLVMGRHVHNLNTSDLPFSYLIEQHGESWIFPGVNLRSVGTIRDAQKWPKRDMRTDPDRLDMINYNLLSPFTIRKMVRGLGILKEVQSPSALSADVYRFQDAYIKRSSLLKGLNYYDMAITKFIGNSVIHRLMDSGISSDAEMRARLKPFHPDGAGEWVDVSGLIAPKMVIDRLVAGIESGEVSDISSLSSRFAKIHADYYDMEWTWAYDLMLSYFKLDPETIEVKDVIDIVKRWKEAVTELDRMVYEDARKEFSKSSMTGFGVDGGSKDREADFEQVRGDFDNNPFVLATLQHIKTKTELGDRMLSQLNW